AKLPRKVLDVTGLALVERGQPLGVLGNPEQHSGDRAVGTGVGCAHCYALLPWVTCHVVRRRGHVRRVVVPVTPRQTGTRHHHTLWGRRPIVSGRRGVAVPAGPLVGRVLPGHGQSRDDGGHTAPDD